MLRITRSLLHHSRCSARRRGRGAAGGLLSIPMLSRRLTVAPFLHPALSASSAVLPIASSPQHYFLFSLSGNATVFDQDDAAGLMPSTATDECTLRCSHPRGPSIPAPGSRAAHAQTVEPAIEPAILSPSVPASQRRPAVPKGRSRLLRLLLSAYVARQAAPLATVVGPLFSESTASTLLRLRRRCAALLI